MNRRRDSQNTFFLKLPAVLLLLVAVACFPGCDTKQGVKAGDAAPEFSSRDAHGQTVSLSRFKGNIVVLYFWTNSCCGERLKYIEPFYGRNRQRGLAVLAIDVGDPREAVAAYARDNGLTFTMLADQDGKIFRQYQLRGFPTIMILDKNGIVRQVVPGDIQPSQLEKLVQRQFDIQKEAEAAYEKVHPR